MDTTWRPGANGGVVNALLVNGSTVYVGGFFGTVGGQSRTDIAALDAVTGQATYWNPGANGRVLALAGYGLTGDAGGELDGAGGQRRLHLAAISATIGLIRAGNAAPYGSGMLPSV